MTKLRSPNIKKLHELTAVATSAAAWRLYQEEMAACGFPSLFFVFSHRRISGADDVMFFSNCRWSFTKDFFLEGAYKRGAMIRWIRDNSGPCSWSWLHRQREGGELTQAEDEVLRLTERYGLKNGLTISFGGIAGKRTKGAVGLAAQNGISQLEVDEFLGHSAAGLVAFANTLHIKLSCLSPNSDFDGLSKSERHLLEWKAEGFEENEISNFMGLSNRELRLLESDVISKLEARNLSHAISKAVERQHINTDGGVWEQPNRDDVGLN